MIQKLFSKYYPKSLLGRIVGLIILTKLISLFLPIEFNNSDFREDFKFYHNIVLITSLFILISVEIFSKNSGLKTWIRILLFTPTVVVSVLFGLVLIFTNDCRAQELGILYAEKNGNATISHRSFNCGATTGYAYDTLYIKPICSFLNFKWQYDSKDIDKSKWVEPSRRLK